MSGCERHRGGLLDMARGGPEDAAARDHAASCAECAGLLATQEALTRALGRLAAADAGRQPSPALEARLRERLAAPGRETRPWPRGAFVGLAAALLAGISLAALLTRRPAPSTAAAPVAATEFAPLVNGAPLDEADVLYLTRVRVPRRALASLGWAGPLEDGPPVEAEVLVGQDGLARGIRFVAAEGGTRR